MTLLRIIAALAALLASQALGQNMLRFPCSQLVVERTDPLVFPGMKYTPHVHQIVGGDSFGVDMPIDGHDLPALSTCTSCSYAQDKSNYWTAALYFQHNNGSFHRARGVGNGGPQGSLNQHGGITMYYIPSGQTTAFAPVRTLQHPCETLIVARTAGHKIKGVLTMSCVWLSRASAC